MDGGCWRAADAWAVAHLSPALPAGRAQKLMVAFEEFPAVLVRMFNSCIADPHQYLALLVLGDAGAGRLDFVQNLQYRFVDLLSLSTVESDDDVVRQSVTHRFNSLRARLQHLQARYQDLNALVKIKSPGLLQQLQRTDRGGGDRGSPSSAGPATGMGGLLVPRP